MDVGPLLQGDSELIIDSDAEFWIWINFESRSRIWVGSRSWILVGSRFGSRSSSICIMVFTIQKSLVANITSDIRSSELFDGETTSNLGIFVLYCPPLH